MQQPGWTPFSNAVLNLPCTHAEVGVVCVECVCRKQAEAFLSAVVRYISQLERYSHQGYELYGKRTREDVEATRTGLQQRRLVLTPEARELIDTQQVEIAGLPHGSHLTHIDALLVYFHAAHLHLKPMATVSYRQGVDAYHQAHLLPEIQDAPNKNRNFATVYFEIHVEDKSAPSRLPLDLRGSYAGRSGEHAGEETLWAPTQPGFGNHTVPSTSSKEEARFFVFCDHHDRPFDSQVAIFEDLNLKIETDRKAVGIVHPEYSGYVNLFTDRATCNSCTALVMQFQYKFGVDVHIIHGGVDDSNGYHS